MTAFSQVGPEAEEESLAREVNPASLAVRGALLLEAEAARLEKLEVAAGTDTDVCRAVAGEREAERAKVAPSPLTTTVTMTRNVRPTA